MLKEQLAQFTATYEEEAKQHSEVKQAHLLIQAQFKETSSKLHALQHTTTIQVPIAAP